MSRSGYSDDYCDPWDMIRWRGAVSSAIRGKRGQGFLRDLLDALDAMPEKRLIANSFAERGAYCTLGVIGAARGVGMPEVTEDDLYEGDDRIAREAAEALNVSRALAAEVMFHNDEGGWDYNEAPEQRWARMRLWVAKQITDPTP